MPAGALLSAPLVANVLPSEQYRPEFRTAVNYWCRHVIEFCWPMYPGIILTEAITGLPLGSVALMQSPMSVVMFIVGLFFFLRRVGTASSEPIRFWSALIGILRAIWPIPLAIAIYGLFKTELALAVLLALVALILVARPARKPLMNALRKGFTWKLVFLVFGTLSFQTVLELTGAIAAIPKLTLEYNLPAELVIFLVCFVTGLLTGMVAAFVALGYTILAGYLYTPEIVPSHIFLAYLSGYLGMILSPTHLCLVMTNEYFKSNLLKVYREIALPLIIVAGLGLIVYLSFWPDLFIP